VKPAELLDLLREFYAGKAGMRQSHAAGAAFVGDYDFNNTYQYIIAREDMHLRWLIDAITELGGSVEDAPCPERKAAGKATAAQGQIIREDRDAAQAFVDRWRDPVETVTNARNRMLLRVILGETLEHRRFFDQALAGRTDLLGRRADGAGTEGVVLPTRWVE
jgi:Mn-containing catalase